MHCPVCNSVNLVMSERQGIEIDYCPQCRGVWLDRGELDKIIDKSAGSAAAKTAESHYSPQQHLPNANQQNYNQQQHYNTQQHSHGYGNHYKKKRGGFLSEIFDFD